MPSIIVKNTKHQHLQWRNVTFPANCEIPVDVVLFNKLVQEFVPLYDKCGLEWNEIEFKKLLEEIYPVQNSATNPSSKETEKPAHISLHKIAEYFIGAVILLCFIWAAEYYFNVHLKP